MRFDEGRGGDIALSDADDSAQGSVQGRDRGRSAVRNCDKECNSNARMRSTLSESIEILIKAFYLYSVCIYRLLERFKRFQMVNNLQPGLLI